jgi:hypothetical protein
LIEKAFTDKGSQKFRFGYDKIERFIKQPSRDAEVLEYTGLD